MEPPPLGAERLGDRVDEGGGVVMEGRLELGDALGARRHGVCADRARAVGGHGADRGPGVGRGELDLEPARQLALVRPDAGHCRTGVARNHWIDV